MLLYIKQLRTVSQKSLMDKKISKDLISFPKNVKYFVKVKLSTRFKPCLKVNYQCVTYYRKFAYEIMNVLPKQYTLLAQLYII